MSVTVVLLLSGTGLLGVASLWGALPRRSVVLGAHIAFQVITLGDLALRGALQDAPMGTWQFWGGWAAISLCAVSILLAVSRNLAALLLAVGLCPSACRHSPAAHLVQKLQASAEHEVARQVQQRFFVPRQLAERLAREGR